MGSMRMINTVTVDDIIRTPYTCHRMDEEVDGAILFSGYLRWEELVARHLPERYLPQYGYVQDIPQSVPTIPYEGIDS